MTDREKLLGLLDRCLPETGNYIEAACSECEYRKVCTKDADCVSLPVQWAEDVRAYLKAQEPVEPHYKELAILGQWDNVPICGACGTIIGYSVKYCPHCGREVRWND